MWAEGKTPVYRYDEISGAAAVSEYLSCCTRTMRQRGRASTPRQRKLPVCRTKLNEVLIGYDYYYGITDNYVSLQKYHFNIRKFLFYWLNRKSYTWEGFRDFMKTKPLVVPKIYVSIYA